MTRLRDRLGFIVRRGGVYLNRARRSVWIHARDRDDFEAAQPLLNWLRTSVSAERLLLTSDLPETSAWLRARYPNDNALPPPLDFEPLIARFFRQLRPAMIILIRGDYRPGRRLLSHAHRIGVPVVVVDASAPHFPAPGLVDRFCVRTRADAEQLSSMGFPRDRVRVTGALHEGDEASRTMAIGETIEVIDREIEKIPHARDPMKDRTAPRRMARLARSTAGRILVANRSARRIDDWESLRERLGDPKTILCLGNGPSCEDPRLRNSPHDALFRVNWRWLKRGILTRPDMVFVGDLATTTRLSACVFGFRTIDWESEILLRDLVLHLSLRRLEYFTYQRVSSDLNDDRWPTHPTNGVVMVATAVGLRPKRIIIGGMDLYQDPAGRYPDDLVGDNNYPQMHSREVEIEALRTVLAQFKGETCILSEPLRRALGACSVAL